MSMTPEPARPWVRRATGACYRDRVGRSLMEDAFSMGLTPEKVWKRGDELIARVLPTPYLIELGASQPASVRGEDWLEARTRGAHKT